MIVTTSKGQNVVATLRRVLVLASGEPAGFDPRSHTCQHAHVSLSLKTLAFRKLSLLSLSSMI